MITCEDTERDFAVDLKPEAGGTLFLDKHIPEGLFEPRTECGRALIAHNGAEKIAIFFDGEGPKFRHQTLTDEKIAYGRWWPLDSIVSNGTSEGQDQLGIVEVEEGVVRMLILYASGEAAWRTIGVTEAQDGFIDDYDLMAEGWKKSFASRCSTDDHDFEKFEWLQPLLATTVFDIS